MKLEKILGYLQCPYCKNKKLFLKTKEKLLCEECQCNFDVVGEVPVLMKSNYLGTQEKNQAEWFENHYSQFSSENYVLENWRLSMLERVFENDFSKNVKTYLDIGCGATGYMVIEAAKRNNWLSFGIDISLEAMLRAKNLAKKQKVEDKTAFVVCSAENLPFKPGVFDYVSAISLLEHLEKDTEAIKNISRIIRRKGYLYICVPNTYKRMWPFLWPIYFYIDKWIGHKRHYAIESLTVKASKDGFALKDSFYNAHLKKLAQILMWRMHLIDEKLWWKIERSDVNNDSKGIQLNAIFKKEV